MSHRLAAAALLIAGGSTVQGQLSDPFVTINVSNANGSGSLIVNLADFGVFPQPEGGFIFNSLALGPAFDGEIFDNNNVLIATVNQLIVTATPDDTNTPGVVDPRSGLVFALVAGGLDTTVEILSTTVTPPSVIGPNASLLANAAFTYTQGTGAAGVTVSPVSGALSSFTYNGGTTFANLINGPLFDPINGNVATSTGFVNSGANVANFTFESNFIISANDQVSGNFGFFAVPSPGASTAIALGGLALLRRRR